MTLKDRMAVVTGAGSGIGRGIATMMAARGAVVAVMDIDEAAAAQTARLIAEAGGRAASYRVDVSRASEIDEAVSAATRELGALDIMVNNAGVLDGYFTVDEMDEEVWRRVIDIDLTGTFLGCKRALREMLPRGRGRIVNMASVAGLNGTGGGAAYIAAKHGVVGLTRSLALEVKDAGIQVNAICPGSVDTPMLEQGMPGARPDMSPEDIATVALYLAIEAPDAMTGQCIDIWARGT